MEELKSIQEVDDFLKRFATSLIFKVGGCHKTMQGFANVEAVVDRWPQLHLGFIRVIQNRPASDHVATKTGIRHESPQLILFLDGQSVFEVNNWAMTVEAVQEGLTRHLGPGQAATSLAPRSDLSAYLKLLENYLAGKLLDEEFELMWLEMFQKDTTPRSQWEVDQLNSLFGDVDVALSAIDLIGSTNRPLVVDLKERARKLLKTIKQ
jgi:bacillithiol system protein YtxJ